MWQLNTIFFIFLYAIIQLHFFFHHPHPQLYPLRCSIFGLFEVKKKNDNSNRDFAFFSLLFIRNIQLTALTFTIRVSSFTHTHPKLSFSFDTVYFPLTFVLYVTPSTFQFWKFSNGFRGDCTMIDRCKVFFRRFSFRWQIHF